MDTVVELLAYDLQIINSDARETYLTALANTAKTQIEGRGITLDLTQTPDCILVAEYAAWLYRSRDSGTGMPEMLRIQLNNRQFHEKMSEDTGDV